MIKDENRTFNMKPVCLTSSLYQPEPVYVTEACKACRARWRWFGSTGSLGPRRSGTDGQSIGEDGVGDKPHGIYMISNYTRYYL